MTALRPHAEDQYAEELALLATTDDRPRPPGWRLSPSAVVTYLLGDGAKITPKYVGPRRLMEVAVSTLVTDRALLLLGVPGTPSSNSARSVTRVDTATSMSRRCPTYFGVIFAPSPSR